MSIYLLSTLGLKDPVARRRYLERFGTRVPAKALEELPDIEPADEAVMGFLRMPVKKYLEGLEALEIRKNPGKAARIRRESDHRYEYFSQDIECWKELYGKDDEPTVADVLISAEEILCFSPAEVKVLNGMMYEDESSEDRIPFRRKNGEDTYWPVSDAEQSLAACRVWILLVEGTGLTYI